MKMTRAMRAGFSMVEILIAVVIMGLMATLIVPNVTRYFSQAKVTKTNATLQALKTAMLDYNRDMQHFPKKSEGGLDALVERPRGKAGQKWDGPYLEGEDQVPEDAWGNEFEYNSPPVRHKGKYRYYEIISYGEDGEEGGKEYQTGA